MEEQAHRGAGSGSPGAGGGAQGDHGDEQAGSGHDVGVEEGEGGEEGEGDGEYRGYDQRVVWVVRRIEEMGSNWETYGRMFLKDKRDSKRSHVSLRCCTSARLDRSLTGSHEQQQDCPHIEKETALWVKPIISVALNM